jgi:hypothetical protein
MGTAPIPANDQYGCTMRGSRLCASITGPGIFPVGYAQSGHNRCIGLAGNTTQGTQHPTQSTIKAKEQNLALFACVTHHIRLACAYFYYSI